MKRFVNILLVLALTTGMLVSAPFTANATTKSAVDFPSPVIQNAQKLYDEASMDYVETGGFAGYLNFKSNARYSRQVNIIHYKGTARTIDGLLNLTSTISSVTLSIVLLNPVIGVRAIGEEVLSGLIGAGIDKVRELDLSADDFVATLAEQANEQFSKAHGKIIDVVVTLHKNGDIFDNSNQAAQFIAAYQEIEFALTTLGMAEDYFFYEMNKNPFENLWEVISDILFDLAGGAIGNVVGGGYVTEEIYGQMYTQLFDITLGGIADQLNSPSFDDYCANVRLLNQKTADLYNTNAYAIPLSIPHNNSTITATNVDQALQNAGLSRNSTRNYIVSIKDVITIEEGA